MSIWRKRAFVPALLGLAAAMLTQFAEAGDLRITLPRRSPLTTVQRLNREGVAAIQKHNYEKAKTLFYKAYLFDPGDPFTLNNLGYVAELEGQVDRAQKFYALSSGQGSEALVDRASSRKLEGETLQSAIGAVHDVPVQINRGNIRAVQLIPEGRFQEADIVLQRTLALDLTNGFTLNNLGVVKESEGEYDEALKYYAAAADSHTREAVIVTGNRAWQGKPVSEMARESAKKLRARMRTVNTPEAKAALLNLRGVSAVNRNDWSEAGKNFAQAYKLNPQNAFSLNNQGYMAELEDDLESAQEFYREAQRADGAGGRIGLSTRPVAKDTKISALANGSETEVSSAMESFSSDRRQNSGKVTLKHRDGSPVAEPPPSTTPPVSQH